VAVSALAEMEGYRATYNIEVETHHDYFAGGVLVHNKPPGCGVEPD
jgi:hypothetical protein